MNSRSEIYDDLAEKYDSRYQDEYCQQENQQIAELVSQLFPDPRLLDVGCGTGLALELGLASPRKYQGIDPSKGMLDQLIKKFNDPTPKLVQATFEEALDDGNIYGPFDVMISLFGSPSYIAPSYMEAMMGLAPHGVVMHYLSGYWPEYESEIVTAERCLYLAQEAVEFRGGLVFELNHFQVGVY